MDSLYECLREARLEKFHAIFLANGFTRSQSLTKLTPPELNFMGISGAEDRRRLLDLVDIIKSVHRTQADPSSGTAARKRQQSSPLSTPAFGRHSGAASAGAVSSNVQSEKKVPRRHSGEGEGSQFFPKTRLEPTRDVSVRERGPKLSAASYVDLLELVSDGSQSDTANNSSQSLDSNGGGGRASRVPVPAPAPAPAPTFSSKHPRVVSKEKGRHPVKTKGYNYGVPSSKEPVTRSKVRASGRLPKEDRIRVCVRKRPLSRKECRASDPDIIETTSTKSVVVKEPKVAVDLTAFTNEHEYIFDEVFDEKCTNEDVYIRAARPLIATAFEGCNATFFAYGQTGAGKTHTMLGDDVTPGLYQLAAQDVFDIIGAGKHGNGLHVWLSFFEIYCGQLFDLLNNRNRLVAREDGSHQVCIAGLTETRVTNVTSLIKVLQFGNSVRSRGTSGVNPDSSRSHALLQLEIRLSDDFKVGKISFIDLAGSERASDMGDPNKLTRMEGAEINQSLLALKECIRSIDQESRHTPFRQSKLTHILKDAFVGNSRTCMIANLSPGQSSCEHTLNTLRYADRVKELRRESGGPGSGASLSQAMNLLMNIPLSHPPAAFHPSNVPSTSTPIRPSHSRQPPAAPHPVLDLSETPLRGHGVDARIRGKSKRGPVVKTKCVGKPRNLHMEAVAAAEGVTQPQADASPGESTDTDSNNVTHPTEVRPAPTVDNLPVIGSLDTEFDFPTSDFNNPEEQLNDLSYGGNDLNKNAVRSTEGRGQSSVSRTNPHDPSHRGIKSKQWPGEQDRPAFSRQNRRDVSNTSAVHSASSDHRHSTRSPAPSTKQPKSSAGVTEGFIHTQSFTHSDKNKGVYATSELQHSTVTAGPILQTFDSFDDELLYASGEDLESKGTVPVRPGTAGCTGEKPNSGLLQALPAVQPAVSSDLTSFAQRSPFRNGNDNSSHDHSPGHTRTKPPHSAQNKAHADCVNHSRSLSDSQTTGALHSSIGGFDRQVNSTTQSGNACVKVTLTGPSVAAIKDWVSHTGDHPPPPGMGGGLRYGAEAPDPPSRLPFAAYRGSETAQHYLTGERRLPKMGARTIPRSSDAGDQASCIREDSTPSGPSSDPTHQSSRREGEGNHSSDSLPSLPSARIDPLGDSAHRTALLDTPLSALPAPFAGSRATVTNALVTEKLMSGSVFSPIHPQPVSTVNSRPGSDAPSEQASYSNIIYPTPVTLSETVTPGVGLAAVDRNQLRLSLISAHEDQLASITTLCKQEMRLLLHAKKPASRSFDDYLHRVNGILAQKMRAITLLQDQIHQYRSRHPPSSAPPSTRSSMATVLSSASSASHPPL